MSHLSTIIKRVEIRVNPPDKRDNLLLQSISNLKEYMDLWDNYTEEEKEKALELYEKYKYLLLGTIYES